MGVPSFIAMMDNGGRRLKADRRKQTVQLGFPDRRSGGERRTGIDRRRLQQKGVDKDNERRRAVISSPAEL